MDEGKMEYQSINEIPEAYQYLFKILIKRGLLKSDDNGKIHVSHDMFEIILMMARLGLLP